MSSKGFISRLMIRGVRVVIFGGWVFGLVAFV